MSARLVMICDCCGKEEHVELAEVEVKHHNDDVWAVVQFPAMAPPDWCNVAGLLHMCDDCVQVWAPVLQARTEEIDYYAKQVERDKPPWRGFAQEDAVTAWDKATAKGEDAREF